MATEPPTVAVIVPALDEAATIGDVVRGLVCAWPFEVIVVDNGSRDGTVDVARAAGARVVIESSRGYGAACLAGIAALSDTVRIVAFIDGDLSDDPSELPRLVGPVADGDVDLVIGTRTRGTAEPGSLTPTQVFGNRLACTLMRWFFGARYTDLGPFRAIDREALERIAMRDRTWGWTVEMQVRAKRLGLRTREIPVVYRCRRKGRSKISGSLVGSAKAGWKIITTILRERLRPAR